MTDLNESIRGDDQLKQALWSLRQVPGPRLHQRIRAITQAPEARTRLALGAFLPLKLLPSNASQRIAAPVVGLVIALVLITFLATSPVVRATLGEIEEAIGRIFLIVTDVMPDSSEATLIDEEQMTVEDARNLAPFQFSLPTHLPEGFAGTDIVGVSIPNEVVAEVVRAQWHDEDGNLLELCIHAHKDIEPIQTIVGPDSLEVVQVNGSEAALVRGGWDNPSGEWRYQDETITVIWVLGDVRYSLLSHGDRLSIDELITVAETVR